VYGHLSLNQARRGWDMGIVRPYFMLVLRRIFEV